MNIATIVRITQRPAAEPHVSGSTDVARLLRLRVSDHGVPTGISNVLRAFRRRARDAALGVILRVRRRSDLEYSASVVCPGTFIPCIGARDGHASASLAAALEMKSVDDVRSLRLDTTPDATAWCVGDGWWLSTV